MEKIIYPKEYFNIYDTLSCGQIFRFYPFKDGYLVISKNLACYIVYEGDNTIIYSENSKYFRNYFDLETDYFKIVEKAKSYNIDYLTKAAEYGKGIRILKQDSYEMFISFIISQNNNISRIKGILKNLCENLGEKQEFMGETYYSFPKAEIIAQMNESFFKSLGFGYRAAYIESTAKVLLNTDIDMLKKLDTALLKKELLKFKGIGGKVADCILLFGFNRFDSFPVDTWIYKLYREDFCGNECNREKITEYFLDMFKEYSGYIQQYLFYYKRENKEA
jgi:N-glycosylase/DNA lyase